MINVVPPSRSCASAWLAAARKLIDEGDEAYNLIVDIDDPVTHTEEDHATILEADKFLREHGANPIVTVANTIFPKELARSARGAKLREGYLKNFDTFEKSWGQYFERMVRWPADGSDQLHGMIDRLRKQQSKERGRFHNIYELAIFDPPKDAHLPLKRQCLSFLSFKLHPDRGLTLTAVYRNHYYIARALGNFIGLGNLMQYIATEAKLAVGPLTCISTHAQIDTSNKSSEVEIDPKEPWTISEARALIKRASEAADAAVARRN
jgi:thymidylate synthase